MQDWSDRRKEIKRKKKEERMEGIRGHPRKEKRVTFTSLLKFTRQPGGQSDIV